ncbi:tetratricopeptide repeat protein, partial [Thermodesulfobacteriota bacterium]
DGGLLAALILSLFLITVMRHGWRVIRDEGLDLKERIITSTAFCSVIAIMLAAFFFFPFRINSTLFMTSLMMGLMEALYLRNYGLITNTAGWKSDTRFVLIPALFILLIGITWFLGFKPFKAEMEHFKYKRALVNRQFKEAEKYMLKAIEYDPHNTAYAMYITQLYMNALRNMGKANDYIEKTLIDFNGDITIWSIHYLKGILKFQMGSMIEAQAAFQKALYFNPTFEPAKAKLAEVKKIIKDHDRVMIKFR